MRRTPAMRLCVLLRCAYALTMPPMRRTPANNYFSETKRKRKMMAISEKVKLVFVLKKQKLFLIFRVLFPSVFRKVSFHEYWLQRRREF